MYVATCIGRGEVEFSLPRIIVWAFFPQHNLMNIIMTIVMFKVVLFPDVTVTSAYYASITGQPMQQLVDSCLPRSAATNAVGRIECEDLTFTLSTEFQGDNPLQGCFFKPSIIHIIVIVL